MQQHCEEKKAAAVGRDRLQSPGALALAGIVPVLREWAAPADAYRGHRLWESDSHLSRLHFVCWLLKPQNAFVSILYWYQWWRPGGVFDSVSDQKRKSAVLHISRRIPHRMKDRQRGACSIMFWAEKTKTKKKKQEATCTDHRCFLSRPVCGDNSLIRAKAVFALFKFSRCFWAQVEWAAHHGVHRVSLKSDSTPLPLWCENTCYSRLYESTTQPCFGDELLSVRVRGSLYPRRVFGVIWVGAMSRFFFFFFQPCHSDEALDAV